MKKEFMIPKMEEVEPELDILCASDSCTNYTQHEHELPIDVNSGNIPATGYNQ